MATPPTFVADYEATAGWPDRNSPHVTSSFNGSLGDVLAVLVANANDSGSGVGADVYTVTSSPAETFTKGTESNGTANNDVWMQPSSAVLSAARTGMTVTTTRSAGGATAAGFDVLHFTGTDGVGAVATKSGVGTAAPSLSITTSFDNSAIAYLIADWAATDATTRTHRTVNGYTPTAGNGQEVTYFRNTTDWMICAAYIPDAGTAGAKSVGISLPATGDCLVIAVEVRGTAAAPAIPPMLIMQTRRPY